MNSKILAVVIGVPIAVFAILMVIYLQPGFDVSQNANEANDVSDIETESVEYFNDSMGLLALPAAGGTYPGIVMIHEWWGLNDNIKDMAEQLASEGYVVLAVDLFNGEVATDQSHASKLTSNVSKNPETAVQNLKFAVEFLRNHEGVNRDAIGSLGWCFGGGWSLQLALNEKMDATGIYYGRLVTGPQELSVIDWPVLGIFGAEDPSIPVEQVKAFEAGLKENNIENEIYIYDGVGHAFANPSGPNYAPEKTKDAWDKTLAFFEKHLK